MQLKPYITDTAELLLNAISKNKKILLEGAQGTHLDIDHGIYPYGTSSNTTIGGACTGTGIPASKINKVVGVVKAYTSRVGEGPFPTELHNSAGMHLVKVGAEYGTTTGRKRRCGWLDLVMINYSVVINGVNTIALTKLDVLSGLRKIKICIAYKHKNKLLHTFPASMRVLAECIPVYKEFKGWRKLKFEKFEYSELPENAKKYIEFIETYLKVPVELVSVGAQRAETLKKV
jgi:adenylosuccinate synthase